MATAYQVEVIVTDESNNTIQGATVVFKRDPLPSGNQYPFSGMGGNCRYDTAQRRYLSPTVSLTGEHYLIVRQTGMRTVYQRLVIDPVPANTYGYTVRYADAQIIVVANGVTQTKTTPWVDSCCQDVAFSGVKQTGAGISLASLTIKIKMYPRNGVVILCGVHYHGTGAPWRGYFQTRWQELVRETWQGNRKVIDPGTTVVFFSCEEQSRFFYVKAKNGAYLTMRRDTMPQLASGFTPGQTYPFCLTGVNSNNSYSIVDLYLHVDSYGAKQVREVDVFSHAWGAGPILYDTNEDAAHRGNPDARDPTDFDGRVKDFKSNTLFSSWHFSQKMADSGRWFLWGCSNDPRLRGSMIAANNSRAGGRAPNAYVSGSFTHWDRLNTLLIGDHHTTRDICYYHTTSLLLGDGYAGALAARLHGAGSRHVWAAVPGSWADYNGKRFWVAWGQTPETRNYFLHEPNLNAHFRPLPSGYVDFIPYQGLAAPAPPADITEYYLLEQAPPTSSSRYFRIIFYHPNPLVSRQFMVNCQPPVTVTPQSVANAAAYSRPGRSGHLHVVQDRAGQTWRFLVLRIAGNPNDVEVVVQNAAGNWTTVAP